VSQAKSNIPKRGNMRPLWGRHWNYGSFWDDLSRVHAKIKTVAAALINTEGKDFIGVTLDDAIYEMTDLCQKAKDELEGKRLKTQT